MRAREEPQRAGRTGRAQARTAPPAERTALTGGPSPAGLPALQRAVGNAVVARMVAEERHEHTADCGHGAPVQRSAVHDVLSTPGRPLEPALRTEMEARLGESFHDVQVHTGPEAAASADSVGARAYTSGSHVVLGRSGTDKHTLAHELTHVVQQRRGPVAGADDGAGLRISDPGDRFEREAEATARRVMAGPVPVRTAGPEHPAAAVAGEAAVQRAVLVGGAEVADPARVVQDAGLDYLLTDTGRLVLSYAPKLTADVPLQVKDAEELVIEVGRIAAMIDLVHSINGSGILGRRTLSRQGTAFTGSNDEGDSTALAVNVLDARGGGSAADIRDVVDESLTARDRGSFSVAMERPVDDDMILGEMAEDVPGTALSEAELAEVREAAAGDEGMFRMLASAVLNNKKAGLLAESHADTVAQYRSLLQDRTQNTAMAIVGRPGADVLTKGPHLGSYESDVPSDRIPPGPGGFTSLVLPRWFEPYGPLLLLRDWPEGVALRFAGNRQITAHYRAKGTDYPVTVDAPDYAAEIEAQLRKFQVIATHILKTASL
ncbi:DUF4157 domain-containing protein [Streptomyces sp. NPDC000348]|uniref:eCIS core domain-containing protein n=1 Tax=Streptomyces sp. NPDC000348 TaxID=3364538 RepID=UPI00369741F8